MHSHCRSTIQIIRMNAAITPAQYMNVHECRMGREHSKWLAGMSLVCLNEFEFGWVSGIWLPESLEAVLAAQIAMSTQPHLPLLEISSFSSS